MIFARYKGPNREGETFIAGKVYFGVPEMDEPDMVSMDFLTIVDESAKRVRITPSEDRFEFLDEVYAVVVEPFDEFRIGEVVLLDDGEINGDTYVSIMGVGLRKASCVAVLDRTNVYPGIYVQDDSTGIWEPVTKVDECLWMTVGKQDILRAPTEFKFAVSYDKELMSMPLLKCVDATGIDSLTEGKVYTLKAENSEGNYQVQDDDGDMEWYLPSRFRMG